MKRKRKDKIRFKLLNPAYLKKEVLKYNNKFSKEDFFLYMLGGIGLSVAFALLFQLEIVFITAIVIACLMCVPGFIVDSHAEMYQKKRYEEARQYIEGMLNSFRQHKKILASLEEVYRLYTEESNMKVCIANAIQYIRDGRTKGDLYKEALNFIEKDYNNPRILDLNDFVIDVERNGGDFEKTAEILLEDKKNWNKNIIDLQSQKNKKFREVISSAVIFTALCVAMGKLMETLPIDVVISKLLLEQIVATVVIIGQILVIKSAKRKMVIDWLGREKGSQEIKAAENYEYLINFNQKKEKIGSLLWAAPFLIAVLPLLMFVSKVVAGIVGAIGFLLLFQHRVNYHMAYKSAANDVLMAYPKWLLNLVLLMQNNNIQVSIQKSYENAPAIMRAEIEKLVIRMNEAPNELESYISFFEIFKNDQRLNLIQDTMKMLYSVSSTGNVESDKQMHSILDMIYQYREISDKLMNENIMMDMDIFFKIPWVVATPKLFMDIYLLLCVGLPAMIR